MNSNFSDIHSHVLHTDFLAQSYQSIPKDTNVINNNIGRVFGRELTNYGIKQQQHEGSLDFQKSYDPRPGVIPPKKPNIQPIPSLKSLNNSSLLNIQKDIANVDDDNDNILTESGLSSKDYLQKYYKTHRQTIYLEDEKLELEHLNYNQKSQSSRNDKDDEYESLDQIDKDNYRNIQYVIPYVNSIFNHLRAIETKYIAKSGYMTTIQNDINEKMRAILIDWIIDVHLKFKLLPETLFMTVNLIDRYLSKVPVTRQKLQLVGISSMLIAAKYEEIYPPEVKEFEFVTDKAYTREEILDMESKILSILSFNLASTSSYRFLERYSMLAKLDEKPLNLAKYLLELSLIEYKMIKYMPSQIACSAIYLVNKICKKEGWPDILQKNTKYIESELKPCAKDLCILLNKANKSNLQAVRKKFASTKYSEVSKILLEKIQNIKMYKST